MNKSLLRHHLTNKMTLFLQKKKKFTHTRTQGLLTRLLGLWQKPSEGSQTKMKDVAMIFNAFHI